MSLINEALKKAQRQRTDGPDQPSAAPSGSGTPEITGENERPSGHARRGGSRSGAPVVLLGAGGAVLVVLSVVATVFLLNRPTPAPAPAASSPRPAPTAEIVSSPPPVIVAPEIKAPILPRPESTPVAVETNSPSASAVAATTTAPAAPALSPDVGAAPGSPAPAAAAPAGPRTDGKSDPRVSAFVDAIRVAGIRSSGNESRVLMNDKVYRVNDLVDRTLAIRLTNVEAHALTFTDANGVVYVKTF